MSMSCPRWHVIGDPPRCVYPACPAYRATASRAEEPETGDRSHLINPTSGISETKPQSLNSSDASGLRSPVPPREGTGVGVNRNPQERARILEDRRSGLIPSVTGSGRLGRGMWLTPTGLDVLQQAEAAGELPRMTWAAWARVMDANAAELAARLQVPALSLRAHVRTGAR